MMVVVLYIAAHVFHFSPPWYVYLIAVFDNIGGVTNYLTRRGEKGDKGEPGKPGKDADLVKVYK